MGGDRTLTRVLTWDLSPDYNPPPPTHRKEKGNYSWRFWIPGSVLLMECEDYSCTPEGYRVFRPVLNGVSVRHWLDLAGNPSKSFDDKFSLGQDLSIFFGLGLTILFLNGQMHCIASCGVKYPPFDEKIVLGKIEKILPHEKHFVACVVM